MRRVLVLAAVLLLSLGATAACSSSDDNGDDEVTVLAASSLTEAFEELGGRFEADHDALVTFSFGSSTTLAEQAGDGAPGDVLATADETSMGVAEDGDALAADAVEFAQNEMVLVVPDGNPAGIRSWGDLNGTDWVRCADEVPCGRVATTLLGLNPSIGEPASLEVDVKSVLAKVTGGEADAGFVYASDAQAAGDGVKVIPIPHSQEALTTYFIAPLEQAGDADLAAAWIDFVTSDTGVQVLLDAGFTVPEGR